MTTDPVPAHGTPGPGWDATPELRALQQLADRHGVMTAYEDTAGVVRAASPDVVVAVLGALGVDIHAVSGAPAVVAAGPPPAAMVSPVVVARPDAPIELRARPGVEWRLVAETGETSETSTGGRADRDGIIVVPSLPVGFHDVEVDPGGAAVPCRILIAPGRAATVDHLTRTWGVFAPLHAVRPPAGTPERAGHLGDIETLARLIAPHGGRIVAVLPLLATFLGDDPFEYSPYQPVSRRFFSELYIDPDRLPTGAAPADLPPAPPAADGLVDYRALDRRARALVDHVRRTLTGSPDAMSDLARFRRTHPDVERYAAFRAAVTRHGPRPAHFDGDADEIDHHVVAQWLMDRQLGDLRDRLDRDGQALALDLPVGCHPDGYDTAIRPHLYAPAAVGAPPDDFFAGGQNWGFPPVIPEAARRDGHREFIAAVDQLARHARVVRIDHVLGLHRLWWIPPGARADEGVYVRSPMDELLAALRIISHRRGCVIIGENLGTVPPSVTEALQTSGLPGMHEEQFTIGDAPRRRLAPIAAETVAGINTHDMASFAGFWDGTDLDDHAALGLRSPEDVPVAKAERARSIDRYRRLVADVVGHPVGADRDDVYEAALEHLARSDADQVMVTVEDLWGEPAPQNVPGTHRERPNWRRRMSRTVDSVFSSPLATRALELLQARATTPRTHSPDTHEPDTHEPDTHEPDTHEQGRPDA